MNTETLQASLTSLPGWRVEGGALRAAYGLDSYEAGVGFAMEIAALAQRIDHHPDALTIGWQKVTVTFVTHDAGGITDRDIVAAGRVMAIARRVGARDLP